ncbi:hypothetical protein [Bradyrhizobium sp. Ash2021]|nr:hypothetical protein [Bradyrhizobium sp. Ash2021]
MQSTWAPSRGNQNLFSLSLHATGVLDQPSEKALIAELSAMNAGM